MRAKYSTVAIRFRVEEELQEAAEKVKDNFSKLRGKIHRFPASLRRLGRRYIVPAAVPIGPYHRGAEHLRQMEDVKHAAAYYFSKSSGHSLEEMYEAVLSMADDARSLYADNDAVAGIADADFAALMLYDGCFLLQCMETGVVSTRTDPWLRSVIFSNRTCIHNDIMLLENQLPWLVVETLMRFSRFVDLEDFIAMMGGIFQVDRDLESKSKPLVLDGSYRPPHLLGLLQFYVSGSVPPPEAHGSVSTSTSAIELAEIGIKLRASKTKKMMDMGIRRGPLLGELYLPPLFLDDTRTCWLVNMAAFEVCTAMSLREDDDKTAVCSYLAVLAMLMDREEDVHELRTRRLVQGQLANREMLDFFKNLTKHLSGGSRYIRIMEDIEAYKRKRWIRVKMHAFIYNNFKTILALFSIIGVLVGIFRTLLYLKLDGR